MKASELRIGNFLNYKNTDDLAIVEIIHGKHFDCRDEYGIFTPNGNYEPIPLTEEWLINFGMEYTDGFSSSRRLYFNTHEYDLSQVTYNEKEGLLRFSNGHPKGTSLIPHIKYVHQLQNLYFALTGEELTIKD